ncbi:hypothetical protein ABZ726_35870, partial [Streptomyces hundungensis]
MPAPELTPPQSSLPEAGAHFGAYALADAATRARDVLAATGAPPRALPGAPPGPPPGLPTVAATSLPDVPPGRGCRRGGGRARRSPCR